MQWSQQVQSCQHRHPCSWHANNGVIRLVFCCSCWIFNCTFSISTIFTKIWVLEHILLLETYTKDSIPALHKIRKYLVEATEEASIAYNKASHFLIDDDDEEFFWKAFKYRTSKRFSQMMSDIREGVDTTHEWLIPAYKKLLEKYWETDEKWKNIRKKTRENRASLLGGSVHCGGSIPLSSTIERMKKQLDRTPTHEEVFKETHTLKSDKSKWVDKRSQDTHEKFIKKLAEVQAQHVEAQAQGMKLPPIDEDLIWEEVCGGQKKNRVYGKGAFFSSSIKSRTTSANSVSGRASTNQNFVPDLREQIHNLNEELFQRVTQQTDERISKLLDTRLAPLEKTQKKLEKLERAIGKAKKEKLKTEEME